ncbi:MAG TPA: GWxTD domain-containing protein [Candidatus Eisenbacteria bacterium]
MPWREGGRLALTVDAAAFPDSAGYWLEVYTRIPPATLAALGVDAVGAARLRLTARLKNSYGARQHEAVQEFGINVTDSTGGFGKVVVMRFPTRPGPQRLMVKLEDLNTHRRGITNIGRKVSDYSKIEGDFDVPPAQAGRDLSDLEFVWHEGPAVGPSVFLRGDRAVLPNAERLYGLFENELRACFAARGTDARPWRWIARVLDPQGRLVAQQESTAAASRWLSAGTTLDMTHEPAGGYDLEVKAWQEGDPGALLRRGHFSVAWRRDSWLRNPRDIEDTVHFLLSADEEDAFVLLHPGEQERYLDDFWRARDPSPGTGENEALNTFLERVRYANANFGRAGIGKGMFSDMGRVYIRYGSPQDTYKQVLPAGDETLRSVVAALSLTEDRPVGDVTRPGLGGDIRPWEVWVYEGNIPLPPDTDPRAVDGGQRKRRLVFLFVDEQGLGDYRLRYSTE